MFAKLLGVGCHTAYPPMVTQGLVAQRMRARVSEARCRGFESLLALFFVWWCGDVLGCTGSITSSPPPYRLKSVKGLASGCEEVCPLLRGGAAQWSCTLFSRGLPLTALGKAMQTDAKRPVAVKISPLEIHLCQLNLLELFLLEHQEELRQNHKGKEDNQALYSSRALQNNLGLFLTKATNVGIVC